MSSKPQAPRAIVTVDFFDETFIRKRPVTEKDIRDSLRQVRESGGDGIVWRLTFLGQGNYHSRVLPRPFFDRDDYRFWIKWGQARSAPVCLPEEEPLRASSIEWMQGTLEAMNPPAVGARVCREIGLSFILWYDIFDGWHPGSYDPFLRENPQYCWTDRTGTRHLRGVASYAFPENVSRVREVVREINRYEPDGLYLSCSCHSTHIPEHPDALAEGFGFEAPVVEEVRTRTGRDPREERADPAILDRVRGEFMTRFFSSVREELVPTADLYLPLQMHPCLVKTSPYWDGPAAVRYLQEYSRWIEKGIAQAVVIGDYEWIFDHWSANWVTKGGKPPRTGDRLPVDQMDLLLPDFPWGKIRGYFFSGWLGSRERIEKNFGEMRSALRSYPAAGAWVHEMATLEQGNSFDLLSRLV